MKKVSIIGAPTDIGASDRGASMGPEALRVAGLHKALVSRGLAVNDRGNLQGPANPWLSPVDGYRHLPEVVAWNQLVHGAVHDELGHGNLPILLGGDHSLSIGSISALLPSRRSTEHHSGALSMTTLGQVRSVRTIGTHGRYFSKGIFLGVTGWWVGWWLGAGGMADPFQGSNGGRRKDRPEKAKGPRPEGGGGRTRICGARPR